MIASHLILEVIMSNFLGEDCWRRHMQGCIDSESTQAAYCRQHGVVIHQFGTTIKQHIARAF
ncbi:MAG: hypothetical protein ACJAVI_005038 [Candidatus Azotimanducaceae bacterium]|jgi:hypothetical protein